MQKSLQSGMFGSVPGAFPILALFHFGCGGAPNSQNLAFNFKGKQKYSLLQSEETSSYDKTLLDIMSAPATKFKVADIALAAFGRKGKRNVPFKNCATDL